MAVARVLTVPLHNDASSPNTQNVDCTGVDTFVAVVEDPVNTAGNTFQGSYGPDALVEMARVKRGGTNRELIVYGIHNPASGVNTLSISRSSNAVGRFLVGAFGFSGTDTSSALTGRGASYSVASSTLAQITLMNAIGDAIAAISVSASGGQSAGGNTAHVDTFDIVSMWAPSTEPADAANWTLNVSQTSGQSGFIGVYVPAAPGGGGPTYTLTAETGSFTLTGNDAGLLRTYRLECEPASFALTGSDAALRRHYSIAAETGAFALSGSDVSFVRSYVLSTEPAAFTLTGYQVGIVEGLKIIADTAQFTFTGNEAQFRVSRRLEALSGSYELSGFDARLIAHRNLSTEPTSFLWTGNDAGLVLSRLLSAETGEFVLTGNDAEFVQTLATRPYCPAPSPYGGIPSPYTDLPPRAC